MIRVGIIGAGANTKLRHIPGFQAIEGVEVVAVANRSKDSAQRVCEEFKIPRALWEPRQIWEAEDIDAVCIGTWPYRHAEFTIASLRMGKHVLTEARMAMNAEEARAMWTAAREHPHLTAMVVPAPFTLEIDAVVHDLVQRRLEKLIAVDFIDSTGAFADPTAPLTWRQDRSLSGNNVLTLGIFYETIMRWVGPAETVMALAWTTVPSRKNSAGEMCRVEIPDGLRIMGRLKRNQATYTMAFSSDCGARRERGCWIHGTGGTIHIPFDGTVRFAFPGEETPRPVRFMPGEGWRVEAEFIESIRKEAPVQRTTFADGLRYMEFTDAVHRSLASRKEEVVPEL